MDSKILLETGTNELELLVFKVKGVSFGINVSKVGEIIKPCKVTSIPKSKPEVRGVMMPRDTLITVIDLKYVLFGEHSDEDNVLHIITTFNNLNMSFMVEEVNNINRISWTEVLKPDNTLSDENGIITGIYKGNSEIVSILDFEKIVSDINQNLSLKVNEVEENLTKEDIKENEKIKILIAEDSLLLNKLLVSTIEKAGFKYKTTMNGQEAYDYINSIDGKISDEIQCIITDIEMPEMDGLTLSKKIKDDKTMNDIPIIVFSSLINEALKRKCESLNIDAMITKPEIGLLINKIKELLNK